MKKFVALAMAVLVLVSCLLTSCGEEAVANVNVKIYVGTIGKDDQLLLADFEQDETLYEGTVSVSGDQVTILDVIDYLDKNVDGVTCNTVEVDGEIKFAGLNDYIDGSEQVSEYVQNIGKWLFSIDGINNVESDAVVTDGTEIIMYYVTWTSDNTPKG